MFHATARYWFAVQVVPRYEEIVSQLLGHKGYLSFVPTQKVRRRWSDRIKVVDLPLFSGYVFCRGQEHSAGLIVSTPQVRRIVGVGGRPSPVNDDEIHALQKIGSSGLRLETCAYPSIGEQVKIISGPFAGISGVLVQIRNKHNFVISVDAIMRSVCVGAEEVGLLRAA